MIIDFERRIKRRKIFEKGIYIFSADRGEEKQKRIRKKIFREGGEEIRRGKGRKIFKEGFYRRRRKTEKNLYLEKELFLEETKNGE